MAGVKITDLNALTTPDPADLYAIVDDVAGSAETKKITLQNAIEVVNALTAITAPAGTDEILIMDDPAGTLAAKKITLANLLLGSTDIIPASKAYHNATQSISNNTWTALAFNSELFDTDAMHDTVTNNNRITCVTAGKYIVIARIEFPFNNTGQRRMYIRKDGSEQHGTQTIPANTAYGTVLNVSDILYFAATEYAEVLVYQNSGGALNINSSAFASPYFMMVRIGD